MDQPQVKEQFSSPEDEIRHLEQKLAEKKKELESQNQPQSEKEVFREVLKSHIEEMKPGVSLPRGDASDLRQQGSVAVQPVSKKPVDTEKQAEREEIIQQLIEIALSRTIQDAVKIAQEESPYLLDELHDHLVDDYYEKLIALRKLEEGM